MQWADLINRNLVLIVDGNRSWSDGSRFVEARQDLRDASVWYEQLSWDVAGTDPQQCQLNDPAPYVIRKRTSVNEHATQLVHSRLTCVSIGKDPELNKRSLPGIFLVFFLRIFLEYLFGLNWDSTGLLTDQLRIFIYLKILENQTCMRHFNRIIQEDACNPYNIQTELNQLIQSRWN